MCIRTFVTALCLAAAAPLAASAATLDFWGPNGRHAQGALSFTDATSGFTATVTAGWRESAGSDAPFSSLTSCGTCIHQHGNGISVWTRKDRTHQISGREYLQLSFDRAVQIDRVWMNAIGRYDEFDMAVDGVDLDVAGLLGTPWLGGLPGDDIAATHSFDRVADFGLGNEALRGQVFTFYTDDHNDDYKLAALSFEAVAPVPLPSSLALMLGAMGLAGAARYRRTRA
ncbi:MAG: PEP-CTERM sorting domain-containing protein [Pseudomonadota bacterium]